MRSSSLVSPRTRQTDRRLARELARLLGEVELKEQWTEERAGQWWALHMSGAGSAS